MKLTVKVKILPTQEQKDSLLKTMEIFNEACNYIADIAFENKTFGQVGLHKLCYYEVREQFKLSAQLTVRAIGKVSESYRRKSERDKLHNFKKYSALVYDQRILSFRGLDTVSILSIDGRFKIPVIIYEYAKLDQRRVRGQADLIYQNNELFLCLVVEVPEDTPINPDGTLGVDFGIINLATTSEGDNFSGKEVDNKRIKINKIKSALQSKGTKSAKRHLKKLSGKERRFKKNTNHIIAKKIVQIAKDTCKAIGLEDLKGFKVTVRKAQREQFGKWSFGELRSFIEYKAKIAGIPVIAVNPKNTSRTCSKCGHISKSNRKSQSEFSCKKCGYTVHADLNGATNIGLRAAINLPIAVCSS